MTPQDLTNATFELAGGFILTLNIFRLHRDKMVRGVHWGPFAFYAAWGFWNLYYYPHLDQWLSLVGGVFVTASIVTYLAMMLYYIRRERRAK